MQYTEEERGLNDLHLGMRIGAQHSDGTMVEGVIRGLNISGRDGSITVGGRADAVIQNARAWSFVEFVEERPENGVEESDAAPDEPLVLYYGHTKPYFKEGVRVDQIVCGLCGRVIDLSAAAFHSQTEHGTGYFVIPDDTRMLEFSFTSASNYLHCSGCNHEVFYKALDSHAAVMHQSVVGYYILPPEQRIPLDQRV